MTDDTPLPFDTAVRRKKLTVEFSGGNQSSNGGLLLLAYAERKVGVCGRLADAMPDRRDASRIRHKMFGYEDAIDLDRLRHDVDEGRGRPLSDHRRAAGLAIDDQSPG
jgi:Transposase DDE domain group 1